MANLGENYPLVKLSGNYGSHVVGSESSVHALNINPVEGKVYAGTWRPLVGTELVFNDYGEHIATVAEHLAYSEHIKVTLKQASLKPVDLDMNESDSDKKVGSTETQNQFLRKALKFAKKHGSSTQNDSIDG